MNKEDIIGYLKLLDLPKGEYNICSSGSLVMRDIQEKASDIDLQVTEECFNYIKKKFDVYFVKELEMFLIPNKIRSFYRFKEYDIEFFVVSKEDLNYDYIDGYPCQNVDDILEFKMKRNLEKDQMSIDKILSYKKIV